MLNPTKYLMPKNLVSACFLLILFPISAVASPTAPIDPSKPTSSPTPVPPRHNSDISPIVGGFQFSTSTDKPEYNAGDPIFLTISMKNITDKSLRTLSFKLTEAKPNIIMQTLDGESVPLTVYGQANYQKPNFMRSYEPPSIMTAMTYAFIPSHQELKYNVRLNRLYDLSMAGAYTISIKQWVAKLDGKGVEILESAPIRFDIVNEVDTLSPLPTNPRAIQY